MKIPLNRDLYVARGSSKSPFKLRFKNPDDSLQDLAGTDFVLAISMLGGECITAKLSTGGLVLADNYLTWALTAEESRRIPSGRNAKFAIERVDPSGTQYPVVIGHISGVDYPNVD